jgi:O-antigen ligase
MLFRLGYGALLLFVFTIPWEGLTIVAGTDTVSRLTGLAAAPVALVGIASRRRVRWHPFLTTSLLFVLWAGVAVLWSNDFDAGFVRALQLTQLVVMAWLLFQYVRDAVSIDSFLAAYVAGSIVTSIALLRAITHGLTVAGFSGNTVGRFNPNDLAYTVAFASTFAWYLGVNAKSAAVRGLFWAVSGLCAITVVLTASRGGVIILSLNCIFAVVMFRAGSVRAKLAATIVIAASFWAIFTFTPLHIIERISTIGAEIQYGTLDYRTTIWRAGLAAFPSHPYFGTGTGSYMVEMAHGIGWYVNAHSVYIKVLLETGMVGFVLLVAMLTYSARSLLRLGPGSHRMFWIVSWVQLILAMGTSNMEAWKLTWFLLTLSAAAGFISARFHEVSVSAAGQDRGIHEKPRCSPS